ncbi:MAG TPA: YhjD/YihY/BrkB family envelope integrity protein [Micromonosporaceae bacterium]
MRIIDALVAGFERGVARARQAWRTFDHVWRALDRFAEVLGTRLAAAISYYGFFAAFALAVVAYSVLGRTLGSQSGTLIAAVREYLDSSLPWVVGTAEQVGRGEVTAVGSVALVIAGVGWVDALRSSQRAVWGLAQHPGNWLVRQLIDFVMLLGLGALLVASLALTSVVDGSLSHLAGGPQVWRAVGPVLEFGVNAVVAAGLLAAVPRLRLSPRRLIPPTLVTAVGIQLLNTAGRWFVGRTESRPAYQLVAGAVGLLVYLYLLNQLIIFAAALAATSTSGTMVDLAASSGDVRAGVSVRGGTEQDGSGETEQRSAVGGVGEPHLGGPAQPR